MNWMATEKKNWNITLCNEHESIKFRKIRRTYAYILVVLVLQLIFTARDNYISSSKSSDPNRSHTDITNTNTPKLSYNKNKNKWIN